MARPDLAAIAAPQHTALVTVECQGAVVGAQAGLPLLAEEARRQALPNLGRLLPVARAAGVSVVHCLFARRADGLGANHNARLFAATGERDMNMEPGSAGASLIPELGPATGDLCLTRLHGVGPMGGTDLAAVLRNLGVTTVVATGVSVNVAITSLVMDAVNAGFTVVLPRDAVAGFPTEYANAVIDQSLKLLATVTDTDALVACWSRD
jgi:nicotinamidase-related amidase